jgi:hypothetical protein
MAWRDVGSWVDLGEELTDTNVLNTFPSTGLPLLHKAIYKMDSSKFPAYSKFPEFLEVI